MMLLVLMVSMTTPVLARVATLAKIVRSVDATIYSFPTKSTKAKCNFAVKVLDTHLKIAHFLDQHR